MLDNYTTLPCDVEGKVASKSVNKIHYSRRGLTDLLLSVGRTGGFRMWLTLVVFV